MWFGGDGRIVFDVIVSHIKLNTSKLGICFAGGQRPGGNDGEVTSYSLLLDLHHLR